VRSRVNEQRPLFSTRTKHNIHNRFVIGCLQDLTHGPLSCTSMVEAFRQRRARTQLCGRTGRHENIGHLEQVKWTLPNVDTCHFKHLLLVISDSGTGRGNSSTSRRCIIDSTPKQNAYYIQRYVQRAMQQQGQANSNVHDYL